MPKDNLLNFEFLSLCFITFLAICNVSVFYNFHLYLRTIGLSGKEAGFIIGLYSFSAMVLYITASRHICLKNSLCCMLTGMLIVVGCGAAYLFTENFWSLAIVRIANGAGMFFVMASCMVRLVAIIPPAKAGLAFSLYSVALLLPYSIMPAVSEMVMPLTEKPTIIYMLTAGLLLPAAILVLRMRARVSNIFQVLERKSGEIFCKNFKKKNLLQKSVLSILLINTVYFTIFSALFYLFEGFAVERGIKNPGFFFTAQMGVMVVIRLLGGRIFDKFSKVALVTIALIITGAGFGLLRVLSDTMWILPIAVVFGLGMGLCVPALNSLMYLVTSPQFRGYNANMMMLALHLGSFMGPFAGAWLIDFGGYNQFLSFAIGVSVSAAVFFLAMNPAAGSAQNLSDSEVTPAIIR